MEMGAGDAPSPPPRYNAQRSALYAARLGAKATPTAPSASPPAPAPLASTRHLGSAAVATGVPATSQGSAAMGTGDTVTSPGGAAMATGSTVASPTSTGGGVTSPGSTVASPTSTGGGVTSPGSNVASPTSTGGRVTSPGSTVTTGSVGISEDNNATGSMATPAAVTGGLAQSPGGTVESLAVTGSVGTFPAATASVPSSAGSVMAAGNGVASLVAPVSLGNLAASPAATSSKAVATGGEGPHLALTGNPADPVEFPMAPTPTANMAAAAVNAAMAPTEAMRAAVVDVTAASSGGEPLASPAMPGSPPAATAAPPTPVKPLPAPFPSPAVVVVAPSPVAQEKSYPTATEGSVPLDPAASQDMGSQSSLGPGIPPPRPPPAPDTLSYLDSVSLMSGTLESLTGPGFPDDASSLGSDSEINGLAYRRTDKYGFLGGSQYSGTPESAIPVDVARQRELKWLDMFSHWDKWLSRRFQKVKLRCRKGIPSSLRAKAWQLLSNSKELLDQNPKKFEELERQPGDPKWLDVIEKDLHRQFPFHEMFAARGGHGQQDLYRILKAYTIYRPDEGYCQAQAPVAAVLLMHMPAEQAFWCLVQICEKYLPGYYSAGLEAIQLDGEIFFALLRRASPIAYRHLKKYKIDPILYMTEWFMCIFSRTLPWGSVLRVWDMFFCEGVKIIFRVGLVLLQNTLGSVEKLRSCQGMYETMEKLRNLPAQCVQEEFLVPEVVNLPVTEALIERENTTQLKKWRETRGELQYKPSRRLHGSRAIHEERHRMNPPLTSSTSLLSLTGFKQRAARGGNFSPTHSAAPPPAASPGQVVSEGLHPALPSPTGNSTPLGGAKKGGTKEEKRREKERQRQEKEQEKKLQKEREQQEKKLQKERKQQKERAKEEAKQKKERKVSTRRKEAKAPPPTEDGGQDGDPTEGSVLQDTYF
ncbi:TBC1 domain family member 10B [Carettochelys insculpta]|uniref:TBC1 domain family member 10B n=1 Tax=Carettochelys insculpta TaxID=44489 RepID=UPI003EBA7584